MKVEKGDEFYSVISDKLIIRIIDIIYKQDVTRSFGYYYVEIKYPAVHLNNYSGFSNNFRIKWKHIFHHINKEKFDNLIDSHWFCINKQKPLIANSRKINLNRERNLNGNK